MNSDELKRAIQINVGIVIGLLVLGLVGFQCLLFSFVNLVENRDTLFTVCPFTIAVPLVTLTQTVLLFLLGKCYFWAWPSTRLACWSILASPLLSAGLFLVCSALSLCRTWYQVA